METSLKNKTISGVAWSGVDNVAQYAVTFIVSIILARLLSPDDYGLIGITLIFTTICSAIINGGFTIALIRNAHTTDKDYNTAFVVNLCVSILLYVIIYLSSPLISDFFNRHELVSLTRVSSLGLVIGALALVQQTRLTKCIDFKTQTKITLISSITSGLIGVVLTLLDYGVWALVAQMLSATTLRTILLWIYNKWIPSFVFSYESFKELFGFGWKMMVGSILDSVWKELYQVVVGKYYTSSTLGQYTRAKGFSQLFSNNLTNVVQRVTFPVLSTIQEDKSRMVDAYRKIIKISMFVSSISMLFLGAISEPLLYCLVGPQWGEAASFLPLICISASAYPLQALNLNMLEVQGRSDLFLGLEIIKKIILIGPLIVGAVVGIFPMLYANLLTTAVSYLLNSHYSGKLIGYSSWMQLKDIASSYCIGGLLALSIYFLKFIPISYWAILPIQLMTGITILCTLCRFFKISEYYEILEIVKPYLNKMKKMNYGNNTKTIYRA